MTGMSTKPNGKPTLFIDANQYLKIFGLTRKHREKVLEFITSAAANIFVPRQIADEVLRNKVSVSAAFFAGSINKLPDNQQLTVDDILFSIDDESAKAVKKAVEDVKVGRNKIIESARVELQRIARSDDAVSKQLKSFFSKAIAATPDEIGKARTRKEFGNQPGKPTNPLGDQLSWEQLLSHCKSHKVKQLWIVSNDTDFCTNKLDTLTLNAQLYSNLFEQCGRDIEARCFNKLTDGLDDFGKHLRLAKDQRLTEEEVKDIRQEIDNLPTTTQTSDVLDAANTVLQVANTVAPSPVLETASFLLSTIGRWNKDRK